MQYRANELRAGIRSSLCGITQAGTELHSAAAEELLMMIAAHESNLGLYRKQIGGGPALGVYQMEPDTLRSNYKSFLRYRGNLRAAVAKRTGVDGYRPEALLSNLAYATIHARLKLYRAPAALPDARDIRALAEFAKRFYNTPDGRATVDDYEGAYIALVLGDSTPSASDGELDLQTMERAIQVVRSFIPGTAGETDAAGVVVPQLVDAGVESRVLGKVVAELESLVRHGV
jgi:hypothetical protein